MKIETLIALNAERAARRPVVVVTETETGDQRLVREPECAFDPLADAIREGFATGRSVQVEAGGRTLFLSVHAPPTRLVVIGAVHISQALGPMAAALDLDLTVIDPRTAYATPERFPGVALVPEWPEDAFRETVLLDRYTALVALTHDPKIDDPALIAGLRAGCFYVGALGSRKTHARRIERLAEAGLATAEIARIHAPIGLDIGSVTPAEIALSILAQLIATLRADRIKGGAARAAPVPGSA